MSDGVKYLSTSTLSKQNTNIINDIQPPIKYEEASFACYILLRDSNTQIKMGEIRNNRNKIMIQQIIKS